MSKRDDETTLLWIMAAALTAILIAGVIMSLTGCVSVGRWMAPIKPADLDPAMQKMLAQKDAEIAKTVGAFKKQLASKDSEIARLRTSKPTALWPIYLVGALCLAGGAAAGYLAGRILFGTLLAVGGACCIALTQFLERFPWAFWIPFGIGVLAGGYCLWDWLRAVRSQKALGAILPAIESQGEHLSRLRTEIESKAGAPLAEIKRKAGL